MNFTHRRTYGTNNQNLWYSPRNLLWICSLLLYEIHVWSLADLCRIENIHVTLWIFVFVWVKRGLGWRKRLMRGIPSRPTGRCHINTVDTVFRVEIWRPARTFVGFRQKWNVFFSATTLLTPLKATKMTKYLYNDFDRSRKKRQTKTLILSCDVV